MILTFLKDNYFNDFFNIAISFLTFKNIHSFFNLFTSFNISWNINCLIHATICILVNLCYFYTKDTKLAYILIIISSGFFSMDFFVNMFYKKFNFSNIIMMIHHVFAIYLLNTWKNPFYVCFCLFLLELSNVPSYLVYFFIKYGAPKDKIKLVKKIQFCVYSFLRVICIGIIFLKNMMDGMFINNKKKLFTWSWLCCLGLYWSYNLYCKLDI
jgi:hypothetical protein